MDFKKLRGSEKAAVFLISLGEDLASQIFKHLDVGEIRKIGNLMSELDKVPQEVVDGVTKEMYEKSVKGGGIVKGSEDYVKKVVLKALDPAKAAEVIDEMSEDEGKSGLEALKWLDADSIANYFKNEHPQIIAVILSQLEINHASEVLKALPEQLKTEVTIRLATLDKVPVGVLKEISNVLRTEFKDSTSVDASSSFTGKQKVADMLNQLDRHTEGAILSQIEENNPDLADEIRQLMFKFEDLVLLDDRAIQEILKEVTNEDLMLALRTATDEIKELIFKNMSERAVTMILEDMEAMGPVRLSDVEKAQQNITKVAKKLESEGKIIIGGGDDVLV